MTVLYRIIKRLGLLKHLFFSSEIDFIAIAMQYNMSLLSFSDRETVLLLPFVLQDTFSHSLQCGKHCYCNITHLTKLHYFKDDSIKLVQEKGELASNI